MNVLTIFIVLLIVGVALYLVNRFVPMDAKIKTILNWAVVIIVVIWLVRASGLWNYLSRATI